MNYSRFRASLLLISCLLPVLLSGQETVANSMLWEIAGKDLAKPSYLLGTFHIIPQSKFQFEARVDSCLARADALVLEIDVTDPTMEMKILQNMSMPDSITLESLLGDDFARVEKFFADSLSIPLARLNSIQPVWVEALSLPSILQEPPVSFEQELAIRAQADSLKIWGLETVEEQMAVFASMPYDSQIKNLLELADDYNIAKKEFKELLEKYLEDDLKGISTILATHSEFIEFGDILLDQRNKRWIVKIEEMLESHSVFIAVGAGHLLGVNGVISLLRDQGYTLSPIYRR